MAEATKRYAVVTGANKGIGLGIVKQLASDGMTVVLTARDEKRGLEAVEKLQQSGLAGEVVFHQLDVANPSTIATLAEFIKTQFGKLDILKETTDWNKVMTENYELAKECVQINYYGAKRTTEALIPLLQLSESPRIVNVSSSTGKLNKIPSDRVKGVFTDFENLTEERIDEVLTQFLEDFKEGSLESKGWPSYVSSYILSKVAMNAYTRVLAKKYPDFRINCVCPGFVKTDINFNSGLLPVEEGASRVVKLAFLPNDGPSGFFFSQNEVTDF
ncbi:(+)-neomenthol dehydrogenase-like isoform X2 [Malus sylvestris]|uniref:(+)-neomenthol dehydrogenase-like isoform X2 n=1 Tax=Malus sylvestris TaxID=3752 RepID=UPI0021AC9230|nr:(+)-neomenthol dehydrogenase-like isoform X2 [Malus sylvestris]